MCPFACSLDDISPSSDLAGAGGLLLSDFHVHDGVCESGIDSGPVGRWYGSARQSHFASRAGRIRVGDHGGMRWGEAKADGVCSYESLPPNFSLAANMVAGAFAGIAVCQEREYVTYCTWKANGASGTLGDVPD